ncbi:twin-arginine translocase subunit TatC [Fervidibacillus halotolerans]|uniref:Sec-independent protein translocase protein TatC n=1 Tax=Fervidibacillus halotolerans TaxID=2980027 RepID=A0A9E8M0A7_9BACI|nr:twin-arginine translocase subunit TatC [Fervidibacillus halotolerans]WAA12575.1 twin-arginine translocase subunit TatC [Fervidibacillus halotolerans]
MNEKPMSIFEHVAELRKRLIFIVVFFFLSMVGSFFIAEPVIVYLQHTEEAAQLQLNFFRLTDPLKIYMQMAFVLSVIITAPVILYQIWAFVAPGLYDRERKVTLTYIPISVLLFFIGIAFAYFILFPFIIRFMIHLGESLHVNQVIGVYEYFQFLFHIILPFGFLFQLPVIILFLTRLGIVSPHRLRKIRKYAYFVLLVIAAFITPPDLLSHMMVTLPLLLLYELSLTISKISYKKVEKERERFSESGEGTIDGDFPTL